MDNQNEILKKIGSGNQNLISEAIQEIKKNGDLSMACSLLELLRQRKADFPETTVINLLADIKDSNFSIHLTDLLRTSDDLALKAILLRIAWESSLDYSAHWQLFLSTLLEGNFEVALEAATALEEMVCQLTPEQRQQLAETLQNATISDDKKFLIYQIREELSNSDE